jgi:hypothetical protein
MGDVIVPQIAEMFHVTLQQRRAQRSGSRRGPSLDLPQKEMHCASFAGDCAARTQEPLGRI